jgi:gamma-glutamylcyclotransferase (GGCT)/AIG2-like uncharacterized protein YtfP
MARSRLTALLREVNEARRRGEASPAEAGVEARFAASRRLAVYGSLAPGRVNAWVLEGLRGRWRDGVVRGHLADRGWGKGLGFPALRWDPAGDRIPVRLLVSAALPDHWRRIDAFEGEDYCRILVEVRRAGRFLAVANLYEARD